MNIQKEPTQIGRCRKMAPGKLLGACDEKTKNSLLRGVAGVNTQSRGLTRAHQPASVVPPHRC
eukprot:347284-Pleurochrysis_carterae.AAC.1